MKTKFRMLLSSMMVILVIGFTACEGDQGDIGPKGDQGLQGVKGSQGDQGIQGVEGQDGDTEASSFGNAKITVSGVDMRGQDYTEVVDFKYLPYNDLSNSTWYMDGDDKKHFFVRREYKVAAKVNGRPQDSGNSVYFELSEVDGELVIDSYHFSSAIIIGKTVNYIYHHISTYNEDTEGFVITNYTYNETTGSLKFDYTYSYTDYNNELVEVSGKVDVIVYESLPA